MFVKNAVHRVELFFSHYDTDQPAEILADILHYCRENNISFEEELETAQTYVVEEVATDEELAEREL